MKRILIWCGVWLVALIASCQCSCDPGPVLLPNAPLCMNACHILKGYDCPEGADPLCADRCERVMAAGYMWQGDATGPKCVIGAESVADIRACNVECER